MIYMYKVAVVGDKDSILGFKALGIDAFPVLDGDEARVAVDNLARKDYGIIFITEQMASLIPDTIERYNNQMIPAVILIPSNQGTLNIGLDRIKDNVEKAVGINIL
ncbi:MAG TPA: V-type ATP synthase subunit F [Tepidimicrobium sp.]|nr:V-type ATP synthase subunit F [Tepidimicrobium sp.]